MLTSPNRDWHVINFPSDEMKAVWREAPWRLGSNSIPLCPLGQKSKFSPHSTAQCGRKNVCKVSVAFSVTFLACRTSKIDFENLVEKRKETRTRNSYYLDMGEGEQGGYFFSSSLSSATTTSSPVSSSSSLSSSTTISSSISSSSSLCSSTSFSPFSSFSSSYYH